jgi:transposase-like protein
LGVDADGDKHVLGIWIAKTPLEDATAGESARFWGSVMADLRNRGVRDIIIACCDGLADFEDAIQSAFPAATVQTCVVHLIRNALRPVARKDRDAVAKELRKIYAAQLFMVQADYRAESEKLGELLAGFTLTPLT